ncbi:GNAT family N-acetyltransferase [Planococcus ruber]|uniref:GNAT family N-acetyltransferase n=1 Tax=Planococcus ruber TaxID=2027871 RepID=UPI001FEF4992|nr:GNAT family N-acetyltransferase [Planococcus ruber]MCJ1908013.1 GNAT family N-acetyltransferase [Planococcus ruber]
MIGQLDHRDEETAKDIQRIQQPAYLIEAELMGFHGIPQLTESIEDIQQSNESFTGFKEEELKGFISYIEEEDLIDIYRLVVHPDFFRRGIAKALLADLMKRYKGYKFIVSTGTANEPAKNLYRSFGFVEQDLFEVAPGITCTNFMKQS